MKIELVVDLIEQVLTLVVKKDLSAAGAVAKSIAQLIDSGALPKVPGELDKQLREAVRAYEAEVRERLQEIINRG